MAKKREERGRQKETGEAISYDLDGSYVSPVKTLRDINYKNILDLLMHSRYAQLLLSLTAVGLLLRFYNLGYNSLWLDEASTHTIAITSIPDIWKAMTGGEFNPPLFYWVEHGMLAFGNNEVVLRFVPALLGVLTIPLVYYIGKEFMDKNIGIIAAAACSLSPFLIFYSQEARAYSMMLFFVAFAMVFYLRALKDDRILNWALFGLLSALAFWSHFYALVIIGGLILYALVVKIVAYCREVKKLVPLAAGLAVFAALCSPLILITATLFASREAGGPTFGVQGVTMIVRTFQQLSGYSDLAMYLLIALFLIGVGWAFTIDKSKGFFLLLLTAATFLISYIFSYKIPMTPRYLIFFAIVFFIGIAVCYYPLCSLFRNPAAVVYGFMAFLLLFNAPLLVDYYSGYSKDDWRGVSSQLHQMARPGDAIVLVPGYISQPLDYYYSHTTEGTSETGVYTVTDLQNVSRNNANNTVYYIVTGDISSSNPEGNVLEWLKEHTVFRGQHTGIYLFTSS